jgi:hypothetical protein
VNKPLAITPEPDQRPLDCGIVRRLFGNTKPYVRLRNGLFGLVVLRSIRQAPGRWCASCAPRRRILAS